MRILVTGATGFLGRALTPALTAAGHSVIAVSRRAAGEVPSPGPAIEPICADLRDPGFPAALPTRADAILHLAQSPDYAKGTDGMRNMALVNVMATALLADFGRKAGCTRFLFASTGGVYEPYAGALTEDAAVAPETAYPATKYAGEVIARGYGRDMAVTILRPFFLFGPGQQSRLIPGLADRIRKDVPVRLNGGEDGLRINPLFVKDAAALLVRALDDGWTGCVNLGGAETVTMRWLANTIAKTLSTDPRFEIAPEARPTSIVGAIDRLRSLAPDFVFTPLAEAIAHTFHPGNAARTGSA